MKNNRSSSSDFVCWVLDDIKLTNMQSPGPSSVYSEYSTKSDMVVTMTPTIRAKMPEISSGLSPKIQYKIDNASPEAARHVAPRMYNSLKRHGFQVEAGKAFEREGTEIQKVYISKQTRSDMLKEKHLFFLIDDKMRNTFQSRFTNTSCMNLCPPVSQYTL